MIMKIMTIIIILTITISCVIGLSIADTRGQTGLASFYSYECANQPMANGKLFDPEKRTCASWFYSLGTVLRVQSLDTGKMTEVIVTDRGPNKRLVREGRVIDLSKKAFEEICVLQKGLTKVVITVKE